MKELTIDKEFESVAYNDEHHIYWDKDDLISYISVTTLIGLFEQEYDEQFWLKYKAFERLCKPNKDILSNIRSSRKFDIDVIRKIYPKATMTNLRPVMDEIKKEWIENNKNACELGTKTHEKYENIFSEKGYYQLSNYGFKSSDGFFYSPNEYNIIKKKQVLPECLISMKTKSGVRVAGQIDLPVFDNPNLYVFDYKGLHIETPILTPEGFIPMKKLNIGDFVFDMNGKKQKILHKSEIHNRDCYEIELHGCPEKIICDDEHRWKIKLNGNDIVVTANDIHDMINSGIDIDIPVCNRLFTTKQYNMHVPPIPFAINMLYSSYSDTNRTKNINTSRMMKELKNEMIKSNLGHIKKMSDMMYFVKKWNNDKYIKNSYINAPLSDKFDIINTIMKYSNASFNNDKTIMNIVVPSSIFIDLFGIIESCGGNVFYYKTYKNGYINMYIKSYDSYFSICTGTTKSEGIPYRRIKSIKKIDSVPTQCIEVDGDTHTYLAGKCLTVTHNTNKKLNFESYKDNNGHVMMKYPLNKLMDCNMIHYTLQLSMYSYMMWRRYPFMNVCTPKIIYARESDKFIFHDVAYLKNEVISMLKYFRDYILDKKYSYIKIIKKDGKFYIP